MGLQAKDDEVVVVVVGDETESKSHVTAGIVAKLCEDSPSELTAAGVRIYTSPSRKKLVVDTVNTELFPAVGQADLSRDRRQQIARQWISQNSLRRLLFGKFYWVVCVLTCPKDCENSLEVYRKHFGWLDTLGVMFQDHKKAIQIVVNTTAIHEDEVPSAQKNIEIFLNQHGILSSNITYYYWSKQGDKISEQFEVEDCVRLEGQSVKLQEPDSPKKLYSPPRTPWDPERVILFGRTGSGKSTLAQMLTKGKLDPDSREFACSSGIRGETRNVSFGQGRGWYVVDTPGFGEPNRSQSTVPTQVAEEKIKTFVKTIDGLFTHFLYVVKKDRIDELEVRLWKFFVCLFGHNDINDHFSIVVTNADDDWVKMNEIHLRDTFEGCGSFLCAEFPSSQEGDDEWEEQLEEIRKESLQRMEDALANLSRNDIVCDFGDLSETAIMNRKGHALQQVRDNGLFLLMRIFPAMSCFTETLTVDQDIALLPF